MVARGDFQESHPAGLPVKLNPGFSIFSFSTQIILPRELRRSSKKNHHLLKIYSPPQTHLSAVSVSPVSLQMERRDRGTGEEETGGEEWLDA